MNMNQPEDIIAEALRGVPDRELLADRVIDTLAAAGYRIVPDDSDHDGPDAELP